MIIFHSSHRNEQLQILKRWIICFAQGTLGRKKERERGWSVPCHIHFAFIFQLIVRSSTPRDGSRIPTRLASTDGLHSKEPHLWKDLSCNFEDDKADCVIFSSGLFFYNTAHSGHKCSSKSILTDSSGLCHAPN